MRKISMITGILIMVLMNHFLFAQTNMHAFNMEGSDPETLFVKQTFINGAEIFPFESIDQNIFGLAINAKITLQDEKSLVRVILLDKNYREYLVCESYSLLNPELVFSLEEYAEETGMLKGIKPSSLLLIVEGAEITLESITYSTKMTPDTDVDKVKKEKKAQQDSEKVKKLNQNLAARGLLWVAGKTEVSEMTYSERKQLYGQSKFPPGIEFYAGGVMTVGETPALKSTSASPMVGYWDWRNRHGKSWITSVKNQGSCGSCWAFAATGATEALVNLYYNQLWNLDLSEQDMLSCSGAGTCNGGWPHVTLDYITSTGIVNEAAFPYQWSDLDCSLKSASPAELIKIGGRIDYGSALYPRTEDDLKRMIIEKGPISGGIYDWSHAMTLVGYKVVEEGDNFFYGDGTTVYHAYDLTVPAGSLLIGKPVWIFKNSWGNWGDGGYGYFEVDVSNIGWTHALKTPVSSVLVPRDVNCTDMDGDGYYWWGLGPKPVTCTGPDQPDGDDSDPTLGPLDQYGYCTPLGFPPVADFKAESTTVSEDTPVQFTDLSSFAPTSWSWTFEGGTPAVSTAQNPVVTYSTPGNYDVTLTVTNTIGTDSKTITDYMTVEGYIPTYCSSSGTTTEEWIASVQLGNLNNTSTKTTTGYQDFTGIPVTLEKGTSYTLTLKPGFSSRSKYEYWAVWIDYNQDYDFEDSGERVFTASRQKSTVSGTIFVPSLPDGDYRMRVSMSRGGIPLSCGSVGSGEVEDYRLTIVVPVPKPPVADFTAGETAIKVGAIVNFTDLSTNNPTNWNWSFPGGTPVSSTLQNPAVAYNTAGTYSVTLTAINDAGSDSETKINFITVTEDSPVLYCEPTNINSGLGYISGIILGTYSNTSAGDRWSLSGETVSLTPGSTLNVALTPSSGSTRNYWRIWIDFNNDNDFDDADEILLVANNKKGVFSGTIPIPSYATGTTRMRVSMAIGSSVAPCDDGFSGEVEDYTVSFGGSSELKAALFPGSMMENQGVNIYPNPAGEILMLSVGSFNPGDRYILFNAQGGKLREALIESDITGLDVAGYSTGVYLISVHQGANRVYRKFVKK